MSNKRGAFHPWRAFFHVETVIETREFTEGISPAELEKQYKKLLRWRDITKRCVYHGLAKPQLFFKACEEVRAFEIRYNPNHDEHGRFTFGDGHASGGYVNYVPRGQKGNGQMMFVGAGDTMAQNDALYYSMYGTKAQSALTGNEKSDKMEKDTVSEADTEQTSLNESGTAETENSLTETYTSDTVNYKSVTECENFDQLKHYMERRYDIKVDDDMKNLDFETVRDSFVGLEDTAKDFPEIMDNLRVIDAKAKDGAIASTNGSALHYSADVFATKESAAKVHNDPLNGIVSSSPKETIVHESAHMVEWLLGGEDVKTWNNNDVAIELTSQAYNNLTPNGSKLVDGFSMTNPQNGEGMLNLMFMVGDISMYASDGLNGIDSATPKEILAEAFTDCYKNGENAQPLSKEIKRLAKEKYDGMGIPLF